MKNVFLYTSITSQSCRQQFPNLLRGSRFVFANAKDPDKKSSAAEKAEKKEKATKTPAYKEDTNVIALQTNIGRKAEILAGLGTRAHAEELKKKESDKELTEKLEISISNLNGILDLERRSKKRTKQILEQLVQNGQLSDEQARKILNLGPEDDEFQSAWLEITRDPNNPVSKDDLTTVKAEAYEFEKIEKQVQEALQQHAESMQSALDSVNIEATRKQAIDNMSLQLGFPLKQDQVVRFQTYRNVLQEDGPPIQEPVYREVTIKDVYFEDVEVEGVPKTPSISPMVALQIRDLWPDKNGHETGVVTFMSAADLKQLADESAMVQVIETRQDTEDTDKELKELSRVLGVEIKEGDEFEYRDMIEKSDGSTTGLNQKVRIINIHKKEDPFLRQEHSQRKDQKETFIELDHPVVVANHPQMVTKKSLTIGEFARWFKRLDALKPLTLKETRAELEKVNRERNQKYERKSKMYPPVKVEEGEVLYYDSDPPKTFVIKRVDDLKDEIHLDNGNVYTPATFLAWVRRNHVEKMTAESQAEKMTQDMKDGDPRKNAALEKAKKEAEAALEDRKENPPAQPDDSNRPPVAPSASYLRQLWTNSHFLSLGDVWEMGKEVLDYIKRYLERYQKGKIGAVGHALFPGGLGSNFKALQQQAENDRVQRFMQAYEQYGYGDLYEQLRSTSDKDELKAIFQAMSAKGWIVWDDPVLLAAISRIARKTGKGVQTLVYNEENIKVTLDAFWGDSSYIDFKHKNESSFNSTKNSEKEAAAAFENDPNGRNLKVRLQELMHAHLQGKWVDRARFEAYLEFAIIGGKLSFPDKVFFLIMGVGAAGPENGEFPGRTLLDVSRIGSLAASSGMLGKYPIIEYFAGGQVPKCDDQGNIILGPDGEPILEKINKNTFKHFIKTYIEKGLNRSIYNLEQHELSPTEGISTLVEREIFSDPAVEKRVLKASGEVANWDHDDMHEFAPQLPEDQIKQLTMSAGGKQAASPEGIKNAIVGFNNFMKIDLEDYEEAMNNGDLEKAQRHLATFLKRMYSFQRLHAILDYRYQRNQLELTRMRMSSLRDFAGVDRSRLVSTHIQEMNDFMRKMIDKMREIDPESFKGIAKDWDLISNYQATENMQKRQQEVSTRFSSSFNKAMAALMKKVGPRGMQAIIRSVQGTGPNKTIKGIMERSNDRAEATKVERERYSFEYEGVAAAQETVEEIEKLRFRLKAEGGKISPEQKRKDHLENLIRRIKSGKATFISDIDLALLEKELSGLQNAVGEDVD